jgi:glycosyltransferase involved in cell wall biosynthesis
MGAWVLSRLCGIPFSFEAHAYDLYEHGGDWFLREKIAAAQCIRSSTAAGIDRLLEVGADPEKVVHVRRGLLPMPVYPEREPVRTPIRIISVGRLVEKKGFLRQVQILSACRDAGIDFRARILGEGPFREKIERALVEYSLEDRLELVGWVSAEDVMTEMVRSDVLLHTGRVARSGDRDGLPNVVGEAMSVGTVVMATPGCGLAEAVVDGETGFLCPLEDEDAWLRSLRRLLDEPETVSDLRRSARKWVEEHFDAERNMRYWYGLLTDSKSTTEDARLL